MRNGAQAGGVVFRRVGADLQFLVVTAKRNPSDWIFPKGHVEAGETPADAAQREVAEEAGVVGRIVAPLGESTFTAGTVKLRVEFFLLEYEGDVPAVDCRLVRWLGYEDALQTLSFEDARRILQLAWAALR